MLPRQFKEEVNAASLALDGTEMLDLLGLEMESGCPGDVGYPPCNGAKRVPLHLESTPRSNSTITNMGILPYVPAAAGWNHGFLASC